MGVCAGQKKTADLRSWLHLNLLWASSGQLRTAQDSSASEDGIACAVADGEWHETKDMESVRIKGTVLGKCWSVKNSDSVKKSEQ